MIDPLDLFEKAFPTLNRTDLQQLAVLARAATYPPETVLCHEGVYESTFYLIAAGSVRITKHMDADEDLVLRRCVSGDFFGEMAIVQDAPRSATVTTLEETTVLEIDKATLEQALLENATLAMAMVRNTFDRLRANDLMTITELRVAFETLEKLDRAKLDFIEVTAHELRTPLTIMRGYASILLTEPTIAENATLKEITEGLISGTQRLHEIVNNMLDVQRIDMQRSRTASVPVSLPVVLRGIEMEFREALQERHLTLKVDWDRSAATIYVEADPGLVSKALHHIVINAIKYTPDGGTIWVNFTYEDDPELERVAHIRIADTGIGIDPEHHSLVFEKFYRLGAVALHSSGKTAFKAGGPGLGLAIARGAIVAHGGRIWVESPGEDEQGLPGSVFHILLPVRARRIAQESRTLTRHPNATEAQ